MLIYLLTYQVLSLEQEDAITILNVQWLFNAYFVLNYHVLDGDARRPCRNDRISG